MWKQANCWGRGCQLKYQNQGTCKAHCDCKRKERIFKIDLFCPSPAPHKDFLSIFVVLSKSGPGFMRSLDQPCTPFQLVFNDLVRRVAWVGEKEYKRKMQELVWSIWPVRTRVSLPSSPASSCRHAYLSYVLLLEAVFTKHFPRAVP